MAILSYDRQLGPFQGFQRVQSTPDDIKRTQTKLVVSEGPVPSEKWLVDPRLKRLFKYQFGGGGWVVIPKGRIVALSADGGPYNDGRFRGYINRFLWNAITIANGGADVTEYDKDGNQYVRKANVPIGVALYNIFEQTEDDTADVLPTVIRANTYIEVPYLASKTDADVVPFGCAYGQLKAGDYVCSDANGKFVKWTEYKVKTQTFNDVVADANGFATVYVDQPIKSADSVQIEAKLNDGTVVDTAQVDSVRLASGQIGISGLGADATVDITVTYTSAIPQGYEQIVGQVYAVDTNLPPEGWLRWAEWTLEERKKDADFNATGFRPQDLTDKGYPYDPGYVDVLSKMVGPEGRGIPGLTDGSNIEVQYTDVKIGEIQPGIPAGTVHNFRIPHVPLVEGTVKVYIGGEEVAPEYIDYKTGLVIVKNPLEYSAKAAVTASYRATGQIAGVPTNWDFKGSIGAVRIMLLV